MYTPKVAPQRVLAYDSPLLGAVTRLFVDSILGWYQRHLRTSTRELAQSGAIVAVQRASSDLKLNSGRSCAETCRHSGCQKRLMTLRPPPLSSK